MPVRRRDFNADDVWDSLRAFYKALSRSVCHPIALDSQASLITQPHTVEESQLRMRLASDSGFISTFIQQHDDLSETLYALEKAAIKGDNDTVHTYVGLFTYAFDDHVRFIADTKKQSQRFFAHFPRTHIINPSGKPYWFNRGNTLDGAMLESRRLEACEATTTNPLNYAEYQGLVGFRNKCPKHAPSYFERLELVKSVLEPLGLQTTSK